MSIKPRVYLNYQKQETKSNNDKLNEYILLWNQKQQEIDSLNVKYDAALNELNKLKLEMSLESSKQITRDMSNESLQISPFDFQTPIKHEYHNISSEQRNTFELNIEHEDEFNCNQNKLDWWDEDNKPKLRKNKAKEDILIPTTQTNQGYSKILLHLLYDCLFNRFKFIPEFLISKKD